MRDGFRNIFGGLAGAIAALYLAGFFLPDFVHVRRTALIDAPREDVFHLVSDFSKWPNWSPWVRLTQNAELTVNGTGVGHSISWTKLDALATAGKQTVVHYQPPRMVETRLELGAAGRGHTSFVLLEEDGKTRVHWSYYTRARDGEPFILKPIKTYLSYARDMRLGESYEIGLAKLKGVAEAPIQTATRQDPVEAMPVSLVSQPAD